MKLSAICNNGFTLIELLTVISVIGVLSAIATAQYSAYRSRAYDAAASTDLRNAVTAEEALFTETASYMSCSNSECPDVLPSFNLNKGVQMEITAKNNDQNFSGTSLHPTGKFTYSFDNETDRSISSALR